MDILQHEQQMKKIRFEQARRALEMGLSPETAAKVSKLPVSVVNQISATK